MEKDPFFKKIDLQKETDKTVQDYLSSNAFTAKKVTDTPRDKNQVVPRGYVNRSATTALRPTTSILGEHYFDTTVSKPVWWNGTNYQDAAGNVI
jgi:hypothetical protein